MTSNWHEKGTKTVRNALDLLEEFMESPEISFPSAAGRKSTIYRFVSILVQRRFLKRLGGGRYSLGAKILQLGYAARQQADLSRLGWSHVEDLASKSAGTATLARRDENSSVCVLRKARDCRQSRIEVGDRRNLTNDAIGRAMLLPLFPMSPAEVEEICFRHLSTHEMAGLIGQMERDSATGLSTDIVDGPFPLQIVAAPVLDAFGACVASIAVLIQSSQVEQNDVINDHVKRAAAALSSDLGWSPNLNLSGKPYVT